MRIRVSCADRYEAQKLASLIYVSESGETHIVQVLNVIGNEMVISIRDGSAHSILLRDGSHAEAFTDFIQSVLEGQDRIAGTATFAEEVEIVKDGSHK